MYLDGWAEENDGAENASAAPTQKQSTTFSGVPGEMAAVGLTEHTIG